MRGIIALDADTFVSGHGDLQTKSALKARLTAVEARRQKIKEMITSGCSLEEIKKTAPLMQVIMVTVYEDSERIFRALKAGANGYLIKSNSPDQLLEAIRDVYKGGAPMSSPIAHKVVNHFHLVGISPRESENLSPRELEVLELLGQGFIYKEIADQLGITLSTVCAHLHTVYEKLHVQSRTEAVVKFLNRD